MLNPLGRRLLIIAVGILAMTALGVDMAVRSRAPGRQIAKAITTGYQRARIPDAEAAEDEALTNSAEDAGYRWAERRGVDQAGECPSYSAAFHRGCAAFIQDQAPVRP